MEPWGWQVGESMRCSLRCWGTSLEGVMRGEKLRVHRESGTSSREGEGCDGQQVQHDGCTGGCSPMMRWCFQIPGRTQSIRQIVHYPVSHP